MYSVAKVEDLVVAVVKRNEREIRITGDAKKAFDKFNKSSTGKNVVATGLFLTGGLLSYVGVTFVAMGLAPVIFGAIGLSGLLGASSAKDSIQKKKQKKN
jgi:hypothetical protein